MTNTRDLEKRNHIFKALSGMAYFEAPQSGIPSEVLVATISDEDLEDNLEFATMSTVANEGEDEQAAQYWGEVVSHLISRLEKQA